MALRLTAFEVDDDAAEAKSAHAYMLIARYRISSRLHCRSVSAPHHRKHHAQARF